MTSLLPAGVKASIDTERRQQKMKNLVVAGSKEKGYKAFFAASDDEHGEELWVTDGTPNGTKLVKDINPGAGSSDVIYLTRFNDKVVFTATDDAGAELWISDGTEEGTYRVKDIHEIASSNPCGFVQVNENQFVFAAMDMDSELNDTGVAQSWLWVSDGTEDGTKRIYECAMSYPGETNASEGTPYCRVGRKVFFKASTTDGSTGEELWVTDGTREGTKMLKDINTEQIATGTAGSKLDHFSNFYNEKLLFKAWSLEYGDEPWASDGTSEGTYLIKDVNPTFDENNKPNGCTMTFVAPMPYNGKFYMRAGTPETHNELGCTNLEPGDFRIFDINTNPPTSQYRSVPDPGVVFDGVYIFPAVTGWLEEYNNHGAELHYTDGETVKMQSDLAPGIKASYAKELTVASGSMYFWNEYDPNRGVLEQKEKLFRINNKDEFPVRVTNLDADGDKIHTIRNLGGDILFARNDENKGIYCYHYRKPDYDAAKDADDLDIEYRTRAEINAGVDKIATTNNAITIYPNPATTDFTITTNETVNDVKIFNVAGSLVKSTGNSKVVNVDDLAAGLYVVVVATDNGTHTSRIIVK